MYSPGSLKVAVVEALPWNVVPGGPVKLDASAVGRAFENVTVPGPRNLLQARVTGAVRGRTAPGMTLASSATQRSSDWELAPDWIDAWPFGPCTKGPLSL